MKSTLLLFLFPLFSIDVFGADVDESLSVMVGDSVTLHTDTKIQTEYVIEWSFGQKSIAMINDGSIIITASDKKLGDRLQLDKQTGDLKIRNIKTTDSGDFKLEFTRTEGSSTKTFSVHVKPNEVGERQSISVLVGDLVTLQTDVPDIQTYDVIRWRFELQNSPVAEINRENGNIFRYDGPDERFRGRLQLDNQTGSLTIMNTRTTDSGLYEADICSRGRHTIHKSFNVTLNAGEVKSVPVMKGKSVTLNPDTDIQIYDFTIWQFRDTVIAEIYKAEKRFSTSDDPDGTFRDRLQLDHQTGSLTIRNTRITDSGVYELKISSSRHTMHKKFNVIVTGLSIAEIVGIVIGVLLIVAAFAFVIYYRCKNFERKYEMLGITFVPVKKEEHVNLDIDLDTGKTIMWKYGIKNTLIAEKNRTFDGPDGKFKDKLNLSQTGSLTITNISTEHAGLYKAKIGRNILSSFKFFYVYVYDSHANNRNVPEMKESLICEDKSTTE